MKQQSVTEDVEGLIEGAEFLAATEVAEGVGIFVETLGRAGELSQQQISWFSEDINDAAQSMLAADNPAAQWQVAQRFQQRRFEHDLSAAINWMTFIAAENLKLMKTHAELWQAFSGQTGAFLSSRGVRGEGNSA